MSVVEAQAALEQAKEAHATAKQAFLAADKGMTAAKVTEAELLVERAEHQLQIARDADAQARHAGQLQVFNQMRAERAAGDERIAAINAELVEVERKARELLFELVDIANAQQANFYPMKQLSLALDQPTPLRPPPELVVRRYALYDAIWHGHHADGIDAHPLRHVVTEWLQRPARRPGAVVGDLASANNVRIAP